MQGQAPVVSRLWKHLSERDESFDKGLKEVLTKEQRKTYEKWRDEQKPMRDDRQRERGPGVVSRSLTGCSESCGSRARGRR
jgi:hypothetical protein